MWAVAVITWVGLAVPCVAPELNMTPSAIIAGETVELVLEATGPAITPGCCGWFSDVGSIETMVDDPGLLRARWRVPESLTPRHVALVLLGQSPDHNVFLTVPVSRWAKIRATADPGTTLELVGRDGKVRATANDRGETWFRVLVDPGDAPPEVRVVELSGRSGKPARVDALGLPATLRLMLATRHASVTADGVTPHEVWAVVYRDGAGLTNVTPMFAIDGVPVEDIMKHDVGLYRLEITVPPREQQYSSVIEITAAVVDRPNGKATAQLNLPVVVSTREPFAETASEQPRLAVVTQPTWNLDVGAAFGVASSGVGVGPSFLSWLTVATPMTPRWLYFGASTQVTTFWRADVASAQPSVPNVEPIRVQRFATSVPVTLDAGVSGTLWYGLRGQLGVTAGPAVTITTVEGNLGASRLTPLSSAVVVTPQLGWRGGVNLPLPVGEVVLSAGSWWSLGEVSNWGGSLWTVYAALGYSVRL